MKKLLTLLAGLTLTLGLFAQNAKVTGDAATLKENVSNGVIEIVFPESTEAKDIEKSSEYYVDYFAVEYSSDTRLARITMVDNTAESRRVINRLLLSNGVRTIDFNGKSYSINDFYSSFLE